VIVAIIARLFVEEARWVENFVGAARKRSKSLVDTF
jgi:hypothetical protein